MTKPKTPAALEAAPATAPDARVEALAESPGEGAVAGGDQALVIGRVGEGLAVLRKRSEAAPVEAGIVRPLREGQPIIGEVVKLTPRTDSPLVCDVETQLAAPSAAQGAQTVAQAVPQPVPHKGPARVASPRYRDGWDRVFGPPVDKSRPN